MVCLLIENMINWSLVVWSEGDFFENLYVFVVVK